MTQQFSSRDEAMAEVRAAALARPAKKPKGVRYPYYGDLYQTLGPGDAQWTYPSSDPIQGTTVILKIREGQRKVYTVLSEHEDGWYADYPVAPYWLFQSRDWSVAETVFVCQGEASAEAITELRLAATTCLGGPVRAELTDWSPLQGKQVVLLPHRNRGGDTYVKMVPQLCYGAGALSVRVVNLPELKDNQSVAEWIAERRVQHSDEQIRSDIEICVGTTAPADNVKPPYKPAAGPRADLQCMSEISLKPLDWVFEGVIPRGKLTVLTGEPGVGKSPILLEVINGVTFGDRGPLSTDMQEPGAVILFSPASDVADTIGPRMEEGGGDPAKVYWMRGVRELDGETGKELAWSFQLDRDLRVVRSELDRLRHQGIDVRLIAIDPIDCYSQAGKGATETARRLAELAAETGVAVVVVCHWSRGDSHGLGRLVRQSRVNESYVAAASSVWVVLPHLSDAKRRHLIPVKAFRGQSVPGLTCVLDDEGVLWDSKPVSLTLDEYMSNVDERQQARKRDMTEPRSELARAKQFLKEQLKDGQVPDEHERH